MPVTLVGKQIDISTALTTHATRGIESLLEKYNIDPVSCAVTLSKPTHFFEAEISIHLKRGVHMRTSGQGDTAYQSLDQAAGKLEDKIRKHKKMLDHHHKHRDQHVEKFPAFDYTLDATEGSPHPDEHPPIIAEMATDIPTLSVSEAAMRLDLGDLSAVVFKNSNHGDLNVLYRRQDGNIGWVNPRF